MIFTRLDSDKLDLGLTSYKGNYPRRSDLKISKNYLNEDELERLNLIVSGYLDTAEYQAKTKTIMTMLDWKKELDRYLTYQRADILTGNGTISRKSANDRAEDEYKKYQTTHHESAVVDDDYFKALCEDIDGIKNINK